MRSISVVPCGTVMLSLKVTPLSLENFLSTLAVTGGGAATGVVGVIGAAALLAVLVSPPPLLVALNTGCVPTVLAFGVTCTWIVLLPPAVIGPGWVQVTV